MARLLGWLLVIAILALGAFMVRDHVRRHPQDVPWTELDLNDPVGRFTGRKLAALAEDPVRCNALLKAAGSQAVPAPPRKEGEQCGYQDAVQLVGRDLSYAPARPTASCPVAAAMLVFERQILQPAAQRHFGKDVAGLAHAGTYSCRRLYNRLEGAYSEHATANAFDLAGFVLADGKRVSVLRDWPGSDPESAFLRDVRDGACSLFATVLSPDYNRAHADHLHLDQARRGETGWGLCR